ncbi:cell adhesion molecule L1-like a isoform X1 [Myxocyprinus asiaticus]|uniref:cell adhesion molecule L1-like a isoform X1 n=1 Tax=Myxocyprinus asiaticus TaxID=70543 RepID=UPI0022230839|nr:cell adhesion molecule L1-like a isoform X1 [Myxocyprinus asiaticus]XP_051518828.1 cell adhesion molecule L1-like a isoform X1 [Myxocyprinus asiaticus]
MRGLRGLCVRLLLAFFSTAFAFYFPPQVEQLPIITGQTSGSIIALLYDESFLFKCEAKGNPRPTYHWTKDGMDFDPHKDPRLTTDESSGSFVIPKSKDKVKYQGKYRCYASNKLGTAISEEAEFIVPTVPKFSKEKLEPVVVAEGDSVVLECNPPKGIEPIQLYWMTKDLRHIEQNERVSMALNGNLYFSNTLATDSHDDYCCFASFSRIRTIVQKPSMALRVRTINSSHGGDSLSVQERKPRILEPSSHMTTYLKKGEELELECIAEGLPTPIIEWKKMTDSLPKRANIVKYGKLLIIPDVTEQDEGKYMCMAKNSLGEDVHHFHVVIEEPPSWREEPVKIQLAETGSDILIKCSATGKPQPTITWKRNGRPLDDFPSTNLKVVDDSIIIYRAEQRDTAVYQCEASNRHGTLLANANVLVMNHPPFILTRNYLEYATMLGKSLIMDCNVFSSPPTTPHWRKEDPEGSVDGERFSLLKNGSLQIHRVEMEDMGQYKCLANNSEGTASITAELFIKDSTRIVEPPQDMKVRRGSMAELECQVECDPTLRRELEILWLKDGIDILSNYTEDSGYFIEDGILQIVNVSHSDEGNYTCIVRTSLDQDRASAYITVLDVPDPPIQLTLSDMKDRSVMLHWLASNDHNSPITEFIIEYEENHWEPEKWKELLRVASIQYSAPLTLYGHINYQFRVIAVNAMGRSRSSMPSKRYKTPPCAPDRNPENIKIEGHLPHQLDISWEPLLPVEHNGPGLEYKLSYRLLGVEDSWTEQMVKRHSFVVSDTPTFVPYEFKIQAHNHHGWAPEPKVVTGYSGEDMPLAAPENVSVKVLNSTLLWVSWSPVPQAALRGHLRGYMVHWWQTQSLLTSKRIPSERQSLSIPGNRSHTMVPGLNPFSEYSLTVNVFNRRGNGPSSNPISFTTPQGVPEQPPILRATNFQKNSITLVWAPPHEANGFLTGYLLQYHTINETQGGLNSVNISAPDTTQWVLHDLREDNWYKFYLSACTEAGCGSAVSEEGGTVPEVFSTTSAETSTGSRQPFSFTSSNTDTPVNATFTTLAVLNISTSVSDTFVRISWRTREEHTYSEIYVAIMNHRDGIWQVSEAVNTSKGFHLIEGLSLGTVYTIRLLASSRVHVSSIFEEVFETRKVSSKQAVSSQDWFVGMMCAVALLTLLVLIGCFVLRNKGGKYAVKEKEESPADPESQAMSEETPCEYSDNDEKPLKSSQLFFMGDDDSCEDSVISENENCEFNEDGSFIGEYSGHTRRVFTEVNGQPPVTA